VEYNRLEIRIIYCPPCGRWKADFTEGNYHAMSSVFAELRKKALFRAFFFNSRIL
jgi:hypothetical protein